MSRTKIEWTGTPLGEPLKLRRDVRLDGLELRLGTYPRGYVLPGFTFNGWLGCEKVSPACSRCYAETWARRVGYTAEGSRKLAIWGPSKSTPRVKTSAENWKRPARWNALAKELGVRFKVFAFSLGDVGEDHPQVTPWREELFALIDATPSLDWLLLTKRPEVLRACWPWKSAPRNVWAGATMEDQPRADLRAPELVQIPAAVHFASVEPMLGGLTLREEWLLGRFLYCAEETHDPATDPCLGCDGNPRDRGGDRCFAVRGPSVSWVIVGGESGAHRRALDLDATERLVASCRAAGVAVFVKQDSDALPGQQGRLSPELWALKQWPEVTP